MIKKEILPITSLRFFAAFYVFLFHFNLGHPLTKDYPALTQALSLGAIGMSLFFMLSGFVLSLSYSDVDEPGFFGKYAFYRFSRIYPVYFIAAVCTLPMLIGSMSVTTGTEYQTYLRYAFLIFANVFLLQAWFPHFFRHWNDGGSWSISTEAFFYAIFPLVIKPIRAMSGKSILILLVCLYACATLPGLSYYLFPQEFSASVFYATPIYRLPEFLIGAIAGTWFSRGNHVRYPSLVFLATTCALSYYLLFGPTFGFVFMASNWAVVPCIALLLWCTASLHSGPLYRLLCNRVLVYFGHVSYSFYSFQVLAFFLLYNYLAQLKEVHPIFHHHWAIMVATFFALMACSSLSYHLLEKVLRESLNRWFKRRTMKVDSASEILPIRAAA